MRSERALIVAAFVVTCVVWGSTWLVIKIGIETVPPFLSVALRFALALPILFVIQKKLQLPNPFSLPQRWLFITIGVLSFSIPFGMIYWAEQYISSGLTAILFAVFPFFVAFHSSYLLKNERLTILKLLGIILGFLGICIIFFDKINVNSEFQVLAILAIVSTSFLQSFCLVLIKKYAHDVHPVTINIGGMFVGSVILFAMSFIFERNAPMMLTASAVYSLLYLAIIGSVIVFIIYYWLVKRVEVIYASLIAFITPIVAVFFGTIFYNESISQATFFGASIVLAGILIANSGEYGKRWKKA
jgi:drug/metabolite transporter (DMT)-like permease